MKTKLLTMMTLIAASGTALAEGMAPSYRPIRCELQARDKISEPFGTVNEGVLEYKPRKATSLTLFEDDWVHVGCSRTWRLNQVPSGTASPSVRCDFSGNKYYGQANKMPVELVKVYNGAEYRLRCDVADAG